MKIYPSVGALALAIAAGYSGSCFARFYSQYAQDKFVHDTFFPGKRGGIFVDIGAHDGVRISNTKFFEESMGWHGICIEPLPHRFKELRRNRSCICIEGCISTREGTEQFRMIGPDYEMISGVIRFYDPRHIQCYKKAMDHQSKEISVKAHLLNKILAEHEMYHINYLSLDTEGGELDILKSIDFNMYSIDVIDVENNYYDPEMQKFLVTKGYRLVTRIACDEIYVHESFVQK